MRIKDAIIVVTGGGSGIGRALVLELFARGAKGVAALDVNEKALAETAALCGPDGAKLLTHLTNVADRAAVEASARAVVARFGAVDAIINNAGIIQPFKRVLELDDATIERVFDVNWKGTLFMTRAYLPHLLTRPAAHVVNVSSMGGFCPVPGQAVYGASKAAVKLFTEALHSELATTKVRVTAVFPGAVATNIVQNSNVAVPTASPDTQAHKTLSAEAAAKQILDAMERDAFRVLVGQDARFLDVLTRLDPRRAARFIGKQLKGLLPDLALP